MKIYISMHLTSLDVWEDCRTSSGYSCYVGVRYGSYSFVESGFHMSLRGDLC